MVGKRLSDAAALAGAARSVIRQHAQIRAQQFDIYANSSSVYKVLNSRFGSISRPAFAPTPRRDARHETTARSTIPNPQALESDSHASGTEGIKQDHHYDRSLDHSAQDPVPDGALDVQQQKAERYPLPDGTIPPKDAPIGPVDRNDEVQALRPDYGERTLPLATENDGNTSLEPESSTRSSIPDPRDASEDASTSSRDARRLQRQYEAQIPAHVAEPPHRQDFMTTEEKERVESEIFVDQERDIFYQAPEATSPVLSALPRIKLPRNAGDQQGGDEHLPQDVNADTFYSPTEKTEKPCDTASDEEQFPEGLLEQLFHSPKAKRLLRDSGKANHVPDGIAPNGRQGFHTIARPRKKASFSTHTKQATKANAAREEEEEVRELAADIAKEIEQMLLSHP